MCGPSPIRRALAQLPRHTLLQGVQDRIHSRLPNGQSLTNGPHTKHLAPYLGYQFQIRLHSDRVDTMARGVQIVIIFRDIYLNLQRKGKQVLDFHCLILAWLPRRQRALAMIFAFESSFFPTWIKRMIALNCNVVGAVCIPEFSSIGPAAPRRSCTANRFPTGSQETGHSRSSARSDRAGDVVAYIGECCHDGRMQHAVVGSDLKSALYAGIGHRWREVVRRGSSRSSTSAGKPGG